MRLPQQTRLFFSSFSQLFNLYLLNNSQFNFKQYKMKTLQWILIALFLILLVSVSHFVYTRITFYQSYDMKLDDVLAFTEKASFTSPKAFTTCIMIPSVKAAVNKPGAIIKKGTITNNCRYHIAQRSKYP